MTSVTVTIPPELQSLLDGETFKAAMKEALQRAGVEFKSIVAAYPAEGDYNRPGPYPKRWYQRLYGPRWARKDGSVGGRNTSQQLQDSWQQEVTVDSIRTWTNVTYSPYVVGNQITNFHEAHGWKDIGVINEDYAERAAEILAEEVMRALE